MNLHYLDTRCHVRKETHIFTFPIRGDVAPDESRHPVPCGCQTPEQLHSSCFTKISSEMLLFVARFPQAFQVIPNYCIIFFFTMQGDAGENRNPKPIALGDSVLVVEFQHPFFRPPLLSMCLLSAFPALLRLELFDMVRSLNSTLTWEGQVATFSHSPFLGSKTVPMWRV